MSVVTFVKVTKAEHGSPKAQVVGILDAKVNTKLTRKFGKGDGATGGTGGKTTFIDVSGDITIEDAQQQITLLSNPPSPLILTGETADGSVKTATIDNVVFESSDVDVPAQDSKDYGKSKLNYKWVCKEKSAGVWPELSDIIKIEAAT